MTTPSTKRVVPRGLVHARRSAMFMLLGLVGSTIALPWTAVALVPLLLGGWESIRAIRALSADHAPRRSVVWSGLGLALIVALAVAVLVPYVFYGTTKGYQDCMAGANTTAAAAQCKAEFYGGLQSIVGGIPGLNR